MYYIRKMSQTSRLKKISNAKNIEDINADLLQQEFRTSDNKLSFWKCADLNNQALLDDTLTAIQLSANKIIDSVFVIISRDDLMQQQIDIDDESLGETAYRGKASLHSDVSGLTYGKLGHILRMFKEAANTKGRTVRKSKSDLQQYIKNAYDCGNIDKTKLNEDLRRHIRIQCKIQL